MIVQAWAGAGRTLSPAPLWLCQSLQGPDQQQCRAWRRYAGLRPRPVRAGCRYAVNVRMRLRAYGTIAAPRLASPVTRALSQRHSCTCPSRIDDPSSAGQLTRDLLRSRRADITLALYLGNRVGAENLMRAHRPSVRPFRHAGMILGAWRLAVETEVGDRFVRWRLSRCCHSL